MPRILVIEDDPQVRAFLREALCQAGYKVLEAQNGREGIRLQNQQPVALLITDIFMPEQDGLETIRHFQTQNASLPIIAISGGLQNLGMKVLDVASKLGAQKILEKPIAVSTLIQAVDELIGHKLAKPSETVDPTDG